jgi:hypothetical protein
MKAVLYRCPVTRELVQHEIAEQPEPGDEQRYDSVECPACGGSHLINRATGKALGQKD